MMLQVFVHGISGKLMKQIKVAHVAIVSLYYLHTKLTQQLTEGLQLELD